MRTGIGRHLCARKDCEAWAKHEAITEQLSVAQTAAETLSTNLTADAETMTTEFGNAC